jgi:hypothetical protein
MTIKNLSLHPKPRETRVKKYNKIIETVNHETIIDGKNSKAFSLRTISALATLKSLKIT